MLSTAPEADPWRKVPEWIGETPDSKPPRAVVARIFRRWKGRCYLTGRRIAVKDKWHVEHIKPVWSGVPGEPHLNRESNMAPALVDAHAEKTAREATDRAKADRIHAKTYGYWPPPARKMQSRPFPASRRER